MGTRRGTIGFTLVELLVAAGLFLVLVAIMIQVLVPAFRISARTSVRSELHQRGHHSMNKLRNDLQRTPTAGLSVFQTAPERTLVVLHRLKDADVEGAPVYDSDLVIYERTGEKLWRYVYEDPAPEFTQSVQRPNLSQTETYLSLVSEGKVMTADIIAFSLADADPDPGRLRQPITVNLALERGRDTEKQTLSLLQKITMRNP
jgi:type II secretory pathway pseudopilin PulG